MRSSPWRSGRARRSSDSASTRAAATTGCPTSTRPTSPSTRPTASYVNTSDFAVYAAHSAEPQH
ncbi:hypothetical protein, partial [Eggerthella sinensis]|uniref:hypothetical protein n=1 Tax=Eggerthella sinensis TaxID=242230 RepID=UPI0022E631A4